MNRQIDVIIIEDNDLFRDSLKEAINKSSSIRCQNTFSSGETALDIIEKEELVPDIILLDIGLPGLSGIELIPELKKLTPSSKIIIITVHDDDENVFKAICSGAAGYLLKDLSSDKIVDSINEVMTGGAPMNSHIAKKVLNMFRDQNIKSDGYDLSEREKEILSLLVDGLSKKQIGEKIFLSHHTVDSHLRNIYAKLEVHSRSSAISKAIKEKLL
ncbi:MAG: response regulator transcription factor [Ignavibacteriota bacterium]|nr:MAG: DNA-binding response regulator [Chlorobiota bacterium]MBE7475476.1 response regulator transcription factor [Ignavibacteriales bacterium]MBL1122443.1 DNA-binding response regulator [Ignavibacteriota bacterium]MCC7093636.1 response regulator transcription factor [Ignavibacteriaceae bacterium]MCE7856018.1 DNA-binding response regulator [Ignavibacteria bacterium CHB3]MEB2296856.1 response regulator transcription factor [Ignavibacteria bacterium]